MRSAFSTVLPHKEKNSTHDTEMNTNVQTYWHRGGDYHGVYGEGTALLTEWLSGTRVKLPVALNIVLKSFDSLLAIKLHGTTHGREEGKEPTL